jgi:hypothetical protein
MCVEAGGRKGVEKETRRGGVVSVRRTPVTAVGEVGVVAAVVGGGGGGGMEELTNRLLLEPDGAWTRRKFL